MKKIKIISLLIALCFVLASCSSGVYSPIKREHESKNDVIKFYNFDWMIDINEIKAGLTKENGEGSYTINYPRVYNAISDYAGSYLFGVYGTNKDEQLLWEVADCKIDHMVFKMITDPSVEAKKATYDQMYLYGGKYYFVDTTSETANTLKSKLNKIYGYGEKGDWSSADINYVWYDSNNNKIELYYSGFHSYKIGDTTYDSEPSLYLEYTCGDINKYIEEERAKYKEEEKKTNANDDKL